ncbi:LLM class flavin-dependent oxidoreductase [Cupriavidus taiwanensis]|uniref:Coenzyme F420-dependent N5,N10-methylene tetrahydromethanopterin reductase n=1 Tax=Cupriavidus taiwanensis TaxID=164546 RepID=A0A375ILW2_9BURK|nr:LLM class flavin-dependent oxidoreductase [Cupriavidus taiwanensis]SOY72285.1 putative Flavin-dependent oxidoreductase [Cupriavidus taiwanensis]SOY72374.1 putative Flavin-dependent oxidoreductase [Cupriavidus taiwanensis]SOY95943.1 putative Flavin-dependent oxidoreductase [Cupriavidus taiwanensis]SOZ30234.1 putative Flavin-dependent oxidoreductase [Cupriavidus taiwanensis]SOZ75065.1 putative Flavin-dependent oxidoreductase [Cupriavidus taiwanensis]
MRFSLIYEAQTVDASRAGDHKVFDEIMEQVVLAEDMGFDVVWAVEHTALTNYAHMSAPETFLAFVAGRTRRIGIGHGVVCLPPAMNHPVKVAERIATLDILSGGRVHFGVGKGGTQQEAGTFGYDLNSLHPMIDESMYLIPKIMTQEEIEHDGEFIKIPRRPIHPKPRQDPHPLMYLACTNADTLQRAGARGMGALVLGFGGPEDVAKKNEIYRAAWESRKAEDQVGFRPHQHLAALCPTIVLEDGLAARKIGIKGQRYFMESLSYWYAGGERPDPSAWDDEHVTATDAQGKAVINTKFASEKVSVDFSDPSMMMLNPNHAYGTVDDCIGYVQRLIDAGADEILFICQMGTVPQWAQLETIRNIGEYVIPHFRKQGRKLRALA